MFVGETSYGKASENQSDIVCCLTFPRPSRKVHQQGCIRLIFYIHLTGSDSPVISKITEKLFERVNFVDKVPTSSGLYECLYSHFCINLLELSDISL